MSFDSSRFTFNPWNDFNGVVMPQGRVQLDSDWNEWLNELIRRIQAGTVDIVGQAVYPAALPNSFRITPVTTPSASITIDVGRMYVDGLLVENHGLPTPSSGGWAPPTPVPSATQPAWDPSLDELVGTDALDYTQQPYFPNAAVVSPFPTAGTYLVYLDVWQREVTFLQYPELIEKAVGIDTTGRIQTVWQVRLLDISRLTNVTCASKDSEIAPWEALIQPASGRLTTGVVQSAPSGVCCLTPNTGYTGRENQLYRVEIHQGSDVSGGHPTFKWSRDNASVATAVTAITGKVLTVQSTGKDSVLRFSVNDWVEITDDWLELNGLAGELHQVSFVTDANNTITLSAPLTGGFDPTNPDRHTRLVRWDQSGKVLKADGTTWVDLNAAGAGEIPIPPAGTSVILENGVTVAFDLSPITGAYKTGDYWVFAARATDGTVEYLEKAPPRGIHHHYARLAVLTLPVTVSDCRVPWPPSEGGCECDSCVTADSHNSGKWTIQQAIDAVKKQGGGKICLGTGNYNVAATIKVQGDDTLPAQNISISGHGLPTLVPASSFNGDGLMLIDNATDIDVNGIAFAGGGGSQTVAYRGPIELIGMTISQSVYVRIERCAFGLLTDSARLLPAIAFGGNLVMDCAVRGNLFTNVSIGVGLLSSVVGGLMLNKLVIEDNQMFCVGGAVFLSNHNILSFSEISFAKNFVQSTSGFVLVGLGGIDVTVEDNTFAIAAATPLTGGPYDAAVVCNGAQTRVANNNIFGAPPLAPADAGSGAGSMSKGFYTWLITAVDGAGRETIAASPASLTFTADNHGADLSWGAVVAATSYNIYRTAANGDGLFLNSTVPATTLSTTDTLADSGLTPAALPTLQNDGIMLGVPSATSTSALYGSQIMNNRISGLTGRGILVPTGTLIEATIIAQNQLLSLGGNGILLNGDAVDLSIHANTIAFVAQAPGGEPDEGVQNVMAGIQLRGVLNASLTENNITNLGSPIDEGKLHRAAIYVIGAIGLRIAGNRIADIRHTSFRSYGIFGVAHGRIDVTENEVRRASILPSRTDSSIWIALGLMGEDLSIRGNLLESFGGTDEVASTAFVSSNASCIFTDNHCLLDSSPNNKSKPLSVRIDSPVIVVSNNYLTGPPGEPVMRLGTLTAPARVTVLGNVVPGKSSSAIHLNDLPLSAPWAPLNLN